MTSRRTKEILERFGQRYLEGGSILQEVEREVIGISGGANGYTTLAQAETLAAVLDLKRGKRLLDVGGGRGWPGLFLAERSGCDVVTSDVPLAAVTIARKRADDLGIADRCEVLAASGTALPFRARSFDAVVHTDVI